MMNKPNVSIIAYCGFDCSTCPVYISTSTNNQKLKEELAIKYSIDLSKINCLGCLAKQNDLFHFCIDCDIRRCCLEKGIEHCGYCLNYPCIKISKVINTNSKSKEYFESFHKNKLRNSL